MKFVILNGSPKEANSITYQYLRYIEKNIPEHEYKVHHIARKIKKIEHNQEYFDTILNDIKEADAIIWIYPVYLMLVPAQLKRFIELVFTREKMDYFKGKNATSLTTSGKFYDHLAHNYIRNISEDWGMNYFQGFSAEMMDLTKKKNRKHLLEFAKHFIFQCNNKLTQMRASAPLKADVPVYSPGVVTERPKNRDYKVIVLSDALDEDKNLNNMINTFVKLMPYEAKIINVHKANIIGGCLGCLKCASENICFYPDEIMTLFQETVEADAIVYAYKVHDRYFSSRMKMFQDRSFHNGHRPVFLGQQQAYFVSGPLRQLPLLRQAIEAMPDVGRANLVGVVTDESEDSQQITTTIQSIVDDMIWGIENNKFARPKTFLGVGGHKIFRDLIYTYQTVLPQDYVYYKKEKLFDWPKVFMGVFGVFLRPLMKSRKFRNKFYAQSGKYQKQMFDDLVKVEVHKTSM